MSRVAVVVPLRPDAVETARQLVEEGPPFDLSATPLEGHCVHLTDHEVVFVFEGPNARDVVEHVVGEADVWQAATAWRALLAGKPRIAETVYSWRRPEPQPLHVPGL
jgi:glycine cleavage system aminomethyltransferase T